MASILDGDVHITGNLSSGGMTLSDSAVTNAKVAAGAAIAASKLQHQNQYTAVLCDHATSAAAKRVQICRVTGATASIRKFGVAASVAATSTGQAVINLYKNGVSILSATITLDNATAAFVLKEPAGYTSTSLAVGDVLEVAIDSVSGSAVPKGVSCHLELWEDAA